MEAAWVDWNSPDQTTAKVAIQPPHALIHPGDGNCWSATPPRLQPDRWNNNINYRMKCSKNQYDYWFKTTIYELHGRGCGFESLQIHMFILAEWMILVDFCVFECVFRVWGTENIIGRYKKQEQNVRTINVKRIHWTSTRWQLLNILIQCTSLTNCPEEWTKRAGH